MQNTATDQQRLEAAAWADWDVIQARLGKRTDDAAARELRKAARTLERRLARARKTAA